jgi:hypothetical protein
MLDTGFTVDDPSTVASLYLYEDPAETNGKVDGETDEKTDEKPAASTADGKTENQQSPPSTSTAKPTSMSAKKKPKKQMRRLETGGEQYLKDSASTVLSAGGGIELVRGGLVGTFRDYMLFCQKLLEDPLEMLRRGESGLC